MAHGLRQVVVDADAANLKGAKAQLAEQQALLNKKLVRVASMEAPR